MARTYVDTATQDIKVGDIYYATSGYNSRHPRFYKVTKLTPKMVEFEGIAELHVHYRRSELVYGSNSPEYYLIPLDTLDMVNTEMTSDGEEVLLLTSEYGKDQRVYHYIAEDGKARAFNSWRENFKSKIYAWTHDEWEAGVRKKITEYYMKEPGHYGGLLTKYNLGSAIGGFCD